MSTDPPASPEASPEKPPGKRLAGMNKVSLTAHAVVPLVGLLIHYTFPDLDAGFAIMVAGGIAFCGALVVGTVRKSTGRHHAAAQSLYGDSPVDKLRFRAFQLGYDLTHNLVLLPGGETGRHHRNPA